MDKRQSKPLGELLTIRHGRNQRDVESPAGAYPILGTGGEIGRAIKPLYDKPSVLIGRKGTIDKPRYMDTPFWTVDTLFYSEIKPENNPKFLYYVFNTIDWKRYNEASGVPSLSASTISAIKVNVPKKPEQERIVRVLEGWDEYIEKLERKIELKERLKKGLVQQLLTKKQNLREDGEVWREYKIGDLLKVLTDYTANGSFAGLKENVKYYSTAEYAALVRTTDLERKIFSPERFTDKRGYEYLKKTSLAEGDLIMSSVGNIGKIYKVPNYQGLMTLAPNTYLIRFSEDLVDVDFIYQLMRTRQFREKALKMVGGGGLAAINKANFRSIKIIIPDVPKQQEIATILTDADCEVEMLNKLLDLMRRQKKYLLKNLITGTIRTPENLKSYEVE